MVKRFTSLNNNEDESSSSGGSFEFGDSKDYSNLFETQEDLSSNFVIQEKMSFNSEGKESFDSKGEGSFDNFFKSNKIMNKDYKNPLILQKVRGTTLVGKNDKEQINKYKKKIEKFITLIKSKKSTNPTQGRKSLFEISPKEYTISDWMDLLKQPAVWEMINANSMTMIFNSKMNTIYRAAPNQEMYYAGDRNENQFIVEFVNTLDKVYNKTVAQGMLINHPKERDNSPAFKQEFEETLECNGIDFIIKYGFPFEYSYNTSSGAFYMFSKLSDIPNTWEQEVPLSGIKHNEQIDYISDAMQKNDQKGNSKVNYVGHIVYSISPGYNIGHATAMVYEHKKIKDDTSVITKIMINNTNYNSGIQEFVSYFYEHLRGLRVAGKLSDDFAERIDAFDKNLMSFIALDRKKKLTEEQEKQKNRLLYKIFDIYYDLNDRFIVNANLKYQSKHDTCAQLARFSLQMMMQGIKNNKGFPEMKDLIAKNEKDKTQFCKIPSANYFQKDKQSKRMYGLISKMNAEGISKEERSKFEDIINAIIIKKTSKFARNQIKKGMFQKLLEKIIGKFSKKDQNEQSLYSLAVSNSHYGNTSQDIEKTTTLHNRSYFHKKDLHSQIENSPVSNNAQEASCTTQHFNKRHEAFRPAMNSENNEKMLLNAVTYETNDYYSSQRLQQ